VLGVGKSSFERCPSPSVSGSALVGPDSRRVHTKRSATTHGIKVKKEQQINDKNAIRPEADPADIATIRLTAAGVDHLVVACSNPPIIIMKIVQWPRTPMATIVVKSDSERSEEEEVLWAGGGKACVVYQTCSATIVCQPRRARGS